MLERTLKLGVSDIQFKTHSSEPVSTKVLDEVAAFKGTEPTELQPPLYDVIDPDALDSLFSERGGSSHGGRISFAYSDCEVVVESDGRVTVRDP